MIKHICRLHLNCLLSAVILMLMVPFLTGFDISQQVTILYDGQTKEVRTNAVKPGKILQEAGIVLLLFFVVGLLVTCQLRVSVTC